MLQGSSAGTWVGIPGDPIAIPTAPDARSRRWPGTPTARHGASPGCSLPGICSARAGNSGPASAGRGGGTGGERLSCSNPPAGLFKAGRGPMAKGSPGQRHPFGGHRWGQWHVRATATSAAEVEQLHLSPAASAAG